MKLYINTKKLNFEEENNLIEHEIILRISDKEFYDCDLMIDLKDDDKFIKDTLRIIYKKDDKEKDTEEIESKEFKVREQDTWWSFPLYKIVNGDIVSFDYTQYQYFADTERRMALAKKIGKLYNPSSEFKILRKSLAYIMDELKLNYPPDYDKMKKKIEEVINKNPKEGSK